MSNRDLPFENLTHLLQPHDHTLTPKQLTLNLGHHTGKDYKAVVIHCMVFDEFGRTLRLRHMGPRDLPPMNHTALHWCTPHITVESYLPADVNDATEISIAEVVRDALWWNVGITEFTDKASVLAAVQTSMILTTGAAGPLPILLIAAGIEMSPPSRIVLAGSRYIDFNWTRSHKVKKRYAKWACDALGRRWVFPRAARQWLAPRQPPAAPMSFAERLAGTRQGLGSPKLWHSRLCTYSAQDKRTFRDGRWQ
ncbi:hypothetical protein LTR85_003502 [Meristemomyces frigidus]|nr:hypothetical protein LTR85_003502 [Meristemomyces frigidus]